MRRTAIILIVIALVAGSCRKKSAPPTSVDIQNKVAVRSIQLFYESPEMTLVPELRTVSLPENPAAALPLILRELLKGPASASTPHLLPSDTTIRGAYLLPEGTAVVDLGGATLTSGWATGSHQELMAIDSIVRTATSNVTEIKRVRILINGTPAETLGGHISLARSLLPRPVTSAATSR